MRARIEDVAEAAGVSIKTVSRVVNQEPNVRAETRQRVEAVIESLKYKPNPYARSLAGARSYLIAFMYDNPSSNYLMEVELGILDACENHRYGMMLAPLAYDKKTIVEKLNKVVAQLRPDGLVLTPPIADNAQLLTRLSELKIPHASIAPMDHHGRCGVAMDEEAAVLAMMEHLISLGHRRIAHILGKATHGARGWRQRGYRAGLKRAGIAIDPTLLIDGDFSHEGGLAAARALLALEPRPTAIFAANDDMASGVLVAAYERGLRVPQDLSVCGFDDVPLARQVYPSLTTVRQPTREMGRLASMELLKSIQEPGSGTMVSVPFELKLRGSTGPVPRSE